MKYFDKGKTETGYGDEGILLKGLDRGNVFSIVINDEGKIVLREECDGYFRAEFSKEEAIEALKEAISWINNNS